MDGWSLAVSIVALIVALGAAWFVWQQTEINRAALELEKQRHAEERRPSFVCSIETVRGGDIASYRLHLGLDQQTPWELAHVRVTIVKGKGVSFSPSQLGVDPGAGSPIDSAEGGPLLPGADLTWRILLDERRGIKVRLRVESRDPEGRSWMEPLDVKVPYVEPEDELPPRV